jgi:hypothetical protein
MIKPLTQRAIGTIAFGSQLGVMNWLRPDATRHPLNVTSSSNCTGLRYRKGVAKDHLSGIDYMLGHLALYRRLHVHNGFNKYACYYNSKRTENCC